MLIRSSWIAAGVVALTFHVACITDDNQGDDDGSSGSTSAGPTTSTTTDGGSSTASSTATTTASTTASTTATTSTSTSAGPTSAGPTSSATATGPGSGTTGGCDTECPSQAPTPPVTEVVFISKVDIGSGTVTLYNMDSGPHDTTDWQFCAGPGRYMALGMTSLPMGETTIDVSAISLGANDSIAVYSTGLDFKESDHMRAFVQWGSAGHGRESVANGAGLWTTGDFVDMCGTDGGLVAVGDTTLGSGYQGVADSCL